MNLLRLFSRTPSAPAARERLQVLLAHERAAVGDSDLVTKLRDEILRAISKHMQVDDEKVSVRMERGAQVSTLAVDIEIPFDAGKHVHKVSSAARLAKAAARRPVSAALSAEALPARARAAMPSKITAQRNSAKARWKGCKVRPCRAWAP